MLGNVLEPARKSVPRRVISGFGKAVQAVDKYVWSPESRAFLA
jgi:hypothetical protein